MVKLINPKLLFKAGGLKRLYFGEVHSAELVGHDVPLFNQSAIQKGYDPSCHRPIMPKTSFALEFTAPLSEHLLKTHVL